MPWKDYKPMAERLKFIARLLDGEKMAPVRRAYERLNLTATALGVAMHPMSQVLQEYSDMFDLQKRFLDYLGIPEGHTVRMLLRLGVANPVEHSPRRSVKDLQRG